MKAFDVKAYVDRDWSLVRDLKDRYWAERKRALSLEEAFAIADDLRRHVKLLRPDWPGEVEREDDLRVHLRVCESLRRVRPSHP